MIALSFFPLSLSCPLLSQDSPSQTRLSDSISCSKRPSIALKSPSFRNRTVVLGSNSSDPKESSIFFDENGAVDDMDGYLNYLSLEYDSVWDTKPSWCQPWTITLTGVLAITGSWLILHSVVVTAVVISLICAWWYIFLYTYPKVRASLVSKSSLLCLLDKHRTEPDSPLLFLLYLN
ncbi:hypothetical protein F0562_021258 [Nyssa sinensis]|uniref:DUF6737 domain-containing protein n=1 Tax=Nyssa sinensis TaxID=561372 RepID=A0A5J5BN80_9ASTE|nr:hypothetical protein F0562_021258 [Nyssa sinensis]